MSSFSHIDHKLEKNSIGADESILGHYDNQEKYRAMRRYQNSKLVINAFVQHLGTIQPSSEVIVNSVCPGVVATEFNRNLPFWIKPVMYVYYKIKARTVAEGGRVLIHAAVVAGTDSHGKYLQAGQIHRCVHPSELAPESMLTSNSGAPFLAQAAGKKCIEKLWAEIVADTARVNPKLEAFS